MEKPAIDDNDRARIRTAIGRAEARTAGEIYVVVARVSGDYRLVPLVWALLAALLVPLPLIAFTSLSAGVIYLAQLALFAATGIVLSLPGIWPRIVPAPVLSDECHARAVEQFRAHGLDITANRTGVLIFVSLTERYAEIVADTAIAAKVRQEVWDDLIARLIAEISGGRLAEGMIGAVERAGTILEEYFPIQPGDRNELVNDIVLL
jgi:putative membrane protein